MRRRPVAGREALAGDDEGGRVGSEVEEELGENVDGQQSVGGELVVRKTHDDEENGKDGETTQLDGLAADCVDGRYGDPVTGDGTGEHNDQVTNGRVVEVLVSRGGASG